MAFVKGSDRRLSDILGHSSLSQFTLYPGVRGTFENFPTSSEWQFGGALPVWPELFTALSIPRT